MPPLIYTIAQPQNVTFNVTGDVTYAGNDSQPFPSAPIQTLGASVLRTTDVLTLDLTQYPIVNPSAFTAVLQFIPFTDGLISTTFFELDDGTNNNRFTVNYHYTDEHAGVTIVGAGVVTADDPQPPYTVLDGQVNRIALTVDQANNRVGISLNGSPTFWRTVTAWPQNLTTLSIGSRLGGSTPLDGYVQQFEIIDGTATDSQLQNLTDIGWQPNVITGSLGSDTLVGTSGDDVIFDAPLNAPSVSGGDVLIGGAGDDSYYVQAPTDVVVENVGGGDDVVFTNTDFTLTPGSEIEELRANRPVDLKLTGNEFNNQIIGSSGDDTLEGGGGSDFLAGGSGDDTYIIRDADSQVYETAGSGTDTVQSFIAYVLPANVENLDLMGDAVSGTGNSLGNAIIGNDSDNVLQGGAGADLLNGGAGDDTVSYSASAAGVTVNLSTGIASGGDAAGDTFVSIENIVGSAFNDALTGDGNDNVLDGGTGADTLTGGGGTDSFIFAFGDNLPGFGQNGATVSGFDTITDFSMRVEKLSFLDTGPGSAVVVAANGTADGVNSVFRLNTGHVVSSHSIANGIVTFSDNDVFLSAVNLASTSDVAAVVQYLESNDIGDAGSSVAFTATIGGVAQTFVYTQGAAGVGGQNGLIDVLGVSANSLTAGLAPGLSQLTLGITPTITSIPENGGGISADEADDATPVVVGLTGTGAVAGDTLTVEWGGQAVTHALTADEIAGNSATVTVPAETIAAQGDGTFNVTAFLTEAGIVGVGSPAVLVSVNTKIAAPSAPGLAAGSDSGASSTDAITNVVAGTYIGTAEAGSTVTLFDTDGTTVIGSGIATGGSYGITTSALAPGTHILTAKAANAAGDVSPASSPLVVIIDTEVHTPNLAVDLLIDAAEVAAVSYTVTGLDGDARGIASFTDGSKTVTATVAANGTFAVDLSTLSNGTITSSLSIADVAGNSANAAGSVSILDTTSSLSLTLAQLNSLGALQLSGYALVTVADAGAVIAALTSSQIGGLAGKGVDVLAATDNTLVLTRQEYQALGTMTVSAGGNAVLADTVGQLGALTAVQLGGLAAAGFNRIHVTNGTLVLGTAQFEALGTVALTGSDAVTLADAGAALAGLTAGQIAALGVAGTARIDATDNVLTLTVAQFAALGTVALTTADIVTLADTGANLSALPAATMAALAGKGIDRIDATDNALSLTVAQFAALGTVALTSADLVTVADTAANIEGLSAAAIAALAAKGISQIAGTDAGLQLSVAQVDAMGTVRFPGTDFVEALDTSAVLGALTTSHIAALKAKGIDYMIATDAALTLNVGQYLALGTLGVNSLSSGGVVLADTVGQLGALTAVQLGGLAATGFNRIHVTNGTLMLGAAQFEALGTVALTGTDAMTLADTGVALAGLTVAQITALGVAGTARIDATDNVLTLTVAQLAALGTVALTTADIVTLADTGANLSALPAATIAALAGKGIDRIDATDNALSLGGDQFNALGTVLLATNDALTLTGTAGNDIFTFSRQTFSAADHVDGGAGSDTLTLNGDYAAGMVFTANTMTNVERLSFSSGHSYAVSLADGNVAAGQTLVVSGAGLGSTNSLTFDGSAETDGSFQFTGGAGSNTFTGGNGADTITAGSGVDDIKYTAAAQSTGTSYDSILGFDFTSDRFSVWTGVNSVDPAVTVGVLSTTSFTADLTNAMGGLGAHDAAIFTPDAGNLAGNHFLVVDTNGIAGYQAGSDLVVRLSSPTNLSAFGTHNFS